VADAARVGEGKAEDWGVARGEGCWAPALAAKVAEGREVEGLVVQVGLGVDSGVTEEEEATGSRCVLPTSNSSCTKENIWTQTHAHW